jgi:hypothetical protein
VVPLQVGYLPPGTLAVRLVRDAFVENIAGVPVQVEIQGAPAKQDLTKADGRATFAHLPIGARVRAVADVGGQRLESETFEMPRDGGVRVLLVVDGSASPVPAGQSSPSQIPTRDQTPVVKGLVVGAMSAIAFVVFVLGWRFGAGGRARRLRDNRTQLPTEQEFERH